MPSRTESGSWPRVCGSSVEVALAASAGEAPAALNTSCRFSVRRVVKIVPNTAVPSAAPTSRK